MALYVKLDAEYASDDKMIEVGPLAELLYVRGLCFAKRTMLDGKISRGQLSAVAIGIPNPTKQVDRLVAVGAWTTTRQGWQITAWLKRNKSALTIGAESEAKRVASQTANHERWHIRENKPSLTCPLCDPLWETRLVRTGSPSESTESESESESEEEAKPESESESESEPTSSSSAVGLTLVAPDAATDDDGFTQIIALIVDAKAERRPPRDLQAWRPEVLRTTAIECGTQVREAIARGLAPADAAGLCIEPIWVRRAIRHRNGAAS